MNSIQAENMLQFHFQINIKFCHSIKALPKINEIFTQWLIVRGKVPMAAA